MVRFSTLVASFPILLLFFSDAPAWSFRNRIQDKRVGTPGMPHKPRAGPGHRVDNMSNNLTTPSVITYVSNKKKVFFRAVQRVSFEPAAIFWADRARKNNSKKRAHAGCMHAGPTVGARHRAQPLGLHKAC